MKTKVILCDLNPEMVQAWRPLFAHQPLIQIVQGSLLQQKATAWVSPTNVRGTMDGGLDAAIKHHIPGIQARVKQSIAHHYGGVLPVGCATWVETGQTNPRYLISTPTMHGSSENISHTMNVVLACAAAFQAIHQHNQIQPQHPIDSVAISGLGAGTGRTPVDICAHLMWIAYDLFCWRHFDNFDQMRRALTAILGDLTDNTSLRQKIEAGKLAAEKGWGKTPRPPL